MYFTRGLLYLHNTGQVFNPAQGSAGTPDADIDAPEAWGVTQGSADIIIAVLDDGLTPNHPDLPNARQLRLPGSNFADGNANDPSPANNLNHGNSCAGIIGATRDNNEGIAGIAPESIIMPVRIFNNNGGGIMPNLVADAIQFAADNGADIISNSWGYLPQNPNEAPSPNLHPVIVTAIQHAVATGRNNRGCILIFAAGNTARHTENANGVIAFPANVNIPGVFTVGASDRDDLQADYSPTSNPQSPNNQMIDIVAPSHRAYPPAAYPPGTPGGIAGETLEMWTIDIPGNVGSNPWPQFLVPGVPQTQTFNPPPWGEQMPDAGPNFLAYTGRFGGTSAAAPQIAGIAALVLSINPDLTYLQVFDLITNAADQAGGYNYVNGRSNEFGFGRANAFSAVCDAIGTLPLTGPNHVCTSGSTYTIQNAPQGLHITWQVSPGHWFQSTTQNGTGASATIMAASNTVGGIGELQFTIQGPCGDIQLTRQIHVGGADPNRIVAASQWGPPIVRQLDASTTTFAEVNYEVPVLQLEGSILEYEWAIWNHSQWDISPQHWGGVPYAEVEIDYWPFPLPSQQSIYIRARNTCGWGNWAETIWEVSGGWRYAFSLYPNPVSEELNLSMLDDARIGSLPEGETYSLTIYNDEGSMVYREADVSQTQKTIHVRHWEQGTYYLHLLHKEGEMRRRFVVER